MYLLKSWKELFEIWSPEHRKVLSFVAFKTLKNSYLIMLKKWWGLIILLGLPLIYNIPLTLLYGIAALWTSCALLAVRASVNLKNYTYFTLYHLNHGLIIVVAVVLLVSNYLLFLYPWLLFFLFLYIDVPVTLTSIPVSLLRTAVFGFFNLPLIILMYALVVVWAKLLLYVPFAPWFVATMIITPALLSLCSIIYTKRLHEHFDLYYFLKFSAEQKAIV